MRSYAPHTVIGDHASKRQGSGGSTDPSQKSDQGSLSTAHLVPDRIPTRQKGAKLVICLCFACNIVAATVLRFVVGGCSLSVPVMSKCLMQVHGNRPIAETPDAYKVVVAVASP